VKVSFVCPACRATVTAPASLQGESYPCPKCKADVDRWPAPINPPTASPAVVRVVPPPVEQAVWHYSVNGARRGPVTTTQLKAQVESGVVRANDLLWREGLPAWVEAGTIPELFPPSALVKPPVPMPAPIPVAPAPPMSIQSVQPIPARPAEETEDERDDRRSRRGDPHTINVHVNQVVERDEDDRPRRRPRRGSFRCPYCGCSAPPIVRRQVSGAGWAVFVLLLLFTIIFCFIGLFIQEDVYYCRDCGARV